MATRLGLKHLLLAAVREMAAKKLTFETFETCLSADYFEPHEKNQARERIENIERKRKKLCNLITPTF